MKCLKTIFGLKSDEKVPTVRNIYLPQSLPQSTHQKSTQNLLSNPKSILISTKFTKNTIKGAKKHEENKIC